MIYVKVRPLLYMLGLILFWFSLMILILGTRRAEPKAKLSIRDLEVLTSIEDSSIVKQAKITNVRVLHVLVDQKDHRVDVDSLAKKYCLMVENTDAFVEVVRIVEPDNSQYKLIAECHCHDQRIKWDRIKN